MKQQRMQFKVLENLEFIWKVWYKKWEIIDESDDWFPFVLEKLLEAKKILKLTNKYEIPKLR